MTTGGWRERYARSRILFSKTLKEYNQKPSLKAYLEIFLSLFTISIFAVFAIRPTIITIGKLIKEIKAKEETLNLMDEKIEKIRVAEKTYNDKKELIQLVKLSIPDTPGPQEVIRQIETLSFENSVNLTTLSIGEVELLTDKKTPPLGSKSIVNEEKITLTLVLSGTYDNLIKFVNQLENLRRPIKFTSLSLGSSQTIESGPLQLSLDNITLPYVKTYLDSGTK